MICREKKQTDTEVWIKLFTTNPIKLSNIPDEETTINKIYTNKYINKGIELLDDTKIHIREKIKSNDCVICLNTITNKLVSECCNNVFCLQCYLLAML